MLPILGNIIEAGGNLLGDIITQTTARSAYKSRYQDEVADLKKAGLNPALAYGANPGNPNTATFTGLGDAALQGGQTAQATRQSAANTDLTQAQANLLKAQTADLIQQVKLRNQNIGADTILKGAQTTGATAAAELSKFQKQRGLALLPGETSLLQADIGLRGAQATSAKSQAALNKFLTHRGSQLLPSELLRSQQTAQAARLTIPQIRAMSQWFMNHPDLGGWTSSAAGLANLTKILGTLGGE